MARVEIIENLNDAEAHVLSADTHALPEAGFASVAGGEINAADVTDDNFDGVGVASPAGGPTTKNYGKVNAKESRFLQRRLMGY